MRYRPRRRRGGTRSRDLLLAAGFAAAAFGIGVATIAIASWLALAIATERGDFFTVVTLMSAYGIAATQCIREWRKTPWRPGLCTRCGYDLRASKYRCSECGDVW